jgi:FdhD protein
MENKNITVHSTKKITKANYSFVDGQVMRKLVSDVVIVEQPLQLTLSWFDNAVCIKRVFAITMRTPGNDEVLILGLLISEGIVDNYNEIESITLDTDANNQNQWLIQLVENCTPALSSIDRYQMTYSSCGLCGTTSLNSLELKSPMILTVPSQKLYMSPTVLSHLSSTMAKQQILFSETGGVHGAALFDKQANLLSVFEDIGRHNAVDKVVGQYLMTDSEKKNSSRVNKQATELLALLVSGRISFEIVQKTIMAGISVLVGVGAPSNLAIQAAQRFDLTLIGFASQQGFNVYHGDWRLSNK